MQQSVNLIAVHRSMEAILAIINIVVNMVVCGVAGASLSQVDASMSYISNNTFLSAPSTGKPVIIMAIVAALLSTPVCFVMALMRLRQARHPHSADSEIHGIINYLSIFIGMLVIGGYGAAGMISAIAASDWDEYINTLLLCEKDCEVMKSSGSYLIAGIYCYRASQFLIGTSIISFVALVLRTIFMVYEVVIRFWKANIKSGQ